MGQPKSFQGPLTQEKKFVIIIKLFYLCDMKNYNDIALNTDNEVIEFLKKSEKEGKVSNILQIDNLIMVDVEWAFNFEGRKSERRKFIYLLTRSNFKYNDTLCRYVRENDEIRFERKKELFKKLKAA
jgi:hypothetical protein